MNDASFSFVPENSTALGFGFRCGFLGLLHMEIVQERLEREFDLDLITTAPGVNYRVTTTAGDVLEVVNPNHLPQPNHIQRVEEPYISSTIITRDDFLGGLLKLCEERRGSQKSLEYLSSNRVVLTYEFPLNEVVLEKHERQGLRVERELREVVDPDGKPEPFGERRAHVRCGTDGEAELVGRRARTRQQRVVRGAQVVALRSVERGSLRRGGRVVGEVGA